MGLTINRFFLNGKTTRRRVNLIRFPKYIVIEGLHSVNIKFIFERKKLIHYRRTIFTIAEKRTNLSYGNGNCTTEFYFGGLRSRKMHRTKGSPVHCGGQLQIGLWLTTLQMARSAHGPDVQGFTQRELIQALSCGQSELTIHSARQFGGMPI